MIKVIKANNYEAALDAASFYFDNKNIVAVETEYNDEYYGVKDGAEIELIHHGENSDNPPAATSFYLQGLLDKGKTYDNFIISHLDTDTLFGIMWAAGFLKKTDMTIQLSEIIGKIDLYGFFNYLETEEFKNLPEHIVDRLLAIGNLVSKWKLPYDDNWIDVSWYIHKLILKIKDLLIKDISEEEKINNRFFLKNLFEIKNKNQEQALVEELSIPGIILTFNSTKKLNDYYTFRGVHYDIILSFNPGSESITISTRTEEIAKQYFGEDGVLQIFKDFYLPAGGRKNIASTSRDKKVPVELLEAIFKFIKRRYLNFSS